ncbi:MAG: N-acetylneuraminate synthase [Candidatus Omnitrophica bacterium]|nr:N-acetylneuraminate synthase [Candidatus Omnitrophota bacterium]MDD4012797.1 N-acetylneuraminate synthase [Candidatus Omnitrophota bacterium]
MSDSSRILIIAEAGVNHNGRIVLAKRLVDKAAWAGADAVKFQTFRAENIVTGYAPKAEYQKKNTSKVCSQFRMLKGLELRYADHRTLMEHCKRRGIMFLSSPFDIESIDFLNALGLKIFKIPSGEITNLPYLRKIGSLGKKVILSTGMSTLKDVEKALAILEIAGTPRSNVTVLHCNVQYPSPLEDVNLLAMRTMRERLKVNIGYSDHTGGIEVAVAGAALGAEVIEKHITLDHGMKGPDHRASLEPPEFKLMCQMIRNVEKAMGDGIKKHSRSEQKNIGIVRKSIVASRRIKKGEVIKEDDLAVKRPGSGLSPMEWDKVVGTKARRSYRKDEMIRQ